LRAKKCGRPQHAGPKFVIPHGAVERCASAPPRTPRFKSRPRNLARAVQDEGPFSLRSPTTFRRSGPRLAPPLDRLRMRLLAPNFDTGGAAAADYRRVSVPARVPPCWQLARLGCTGSGLAAKQKAAALTTAPAKRVSRIRYYRPSALQPHPTPIHPGPAGLDEVRTLVTSRNADLFIARQRNDRGHRDGWPSRPVRSPAIKFIAVERLPDQTWFFRQDPMGNFLFKSAPPGLPVTLFFCANLYCPRGTRLFLAPCCRDICPHKRPDIGR